LQKNISISHASPVPASFLGEDYFELEVPIGIGTLFAKCVVTPATEQGRLL
jgi:hypothetical protein